MMKWVFSIVKKFEKHVTASWYPFALGLIAAIDYFIIIVPLIALQVTSIMSKPTRWIRLTTFTAGGSILGTALYASLIRMHGISFLQNHFSELLTSPLWMKSHEWISHDGVWALFAISALPLADHPAVAVAALTHMPMSELLIAMIAAKIIKFGFFGWAASHAPKFLLKFKVLSREIEEIKRN